MRKKVASVGIFLICMIILLSGQVQANVQSRPNATSLTGRTASDFFALIRQMETSGQSMGLNASVDSTGKETSSSNNIDVHMIKNTEYGGAAMLSASSYGAAPTGSSNATTTGNEYGIYQMAAGNWEYVAGMLENTNNSYVTNIKNASKCYWNYYTNPSNSYSDYSGYVPGDATKETAGWKSAGFSNFVNSGDPVFIRGYNGLFSFSSSGGNGGSDCSSRAAAVCGAGL